MFPLTLIGFELLLCFLRRISFSLSWKIRLKGYSLFSFAAVKAQIYRGNKSFGFHWLSVHTFKKESNSRWKDGFICKSASVSAENHLKKGSWKKKPHPLLCSCFDRLSSNGADGFPVKITGKPVAEDWLGLCTRGCPPSLQRRCRLCLSSGCLDLATPGNDGLEAATSCLGVSFSFPSTSQCKVSWKRDCQY